MVLKHNSSRSRASVAVTESATVPQKYDNPAVVSKPKSHVDHLADRVSSCIVFISSFSCFIIWIIA